ncbi:MAG: TetR/AcrR family transcriptional regulator [Candidatus Phaeomarinobacter sp.]
MRQTQTGQKPKQARAIKTEQALLDALERILARKSFTELTVSELAREAGVTTGAIYRRFTDKEDVLRTAFQRFTERPRMHDTDYPSSMSDRQVLERYFDDLMRFTLSNIPLMRATNTLNDLQSFDQMTHARAASAEWLAGRIQSSHLEEDELKRRCQFVVRIATATFRDTFLSGRGVADSETHDGNSHDRALERLSIDLAELAEGYLSLAG